MENIAIRIVFGQEQNMCFDGRGGREGMVEAIYGRMADARQMSRAEWPMARLILAKGHANRCYRSNGFCEGKRRLIGMVKVEDFLWGGIGNDFDLEFGGIFS